MSYVLCPFVIAIFVCDCDVANLYAIGIEGIAILTDIRYQMRNVASLYVIRAE